MIELNGTYGEGGGALVRVALALSTLTGKEFRVADIRAGREERGLKAQHLQAIKALKQICDAQTNEVDIGTTELWFKPGKIKKGTYEIDIGTAGSITLLLQALILPMMFAPGKVTLKIHGGTCGKWQASVDYLQNVLLPQLRGFVKKIELKILKRGYYPKGGGLVVLEINPLIKRNSVSSWQEFQTELTQVIPIINLDKQGRLEQIRGVVNVSADLELKEIGERIKLATENCLKELKAPIDIRVEYVQAPSTGGEVVVWALCRSSESNLTIIGGDALIEKNKSSEEVGKEAAEELKEQISTGAAADAHLADQLISFMGLLPGSKMKVSAVSEHTKTNMYVVEKFLGVGFETKENVVRVISR